MPLCRFQLHNTGSQTTRIGWVEPENERVYELSDTLGNLLSMEANLRLQRIAALRRQAVATYPLNNIVLRAPVDEQEVWACGVTYERSRNARMEESTEQDVYAQVYSAARPEIFMKASGWRCIGPNAPVAIRPDSTWDVPEPELTLVLDASGAIAGYTVGNDVSSRSIEGENPLYLPQAKTYNASCALGPWIVLSEELPDPSNLSIEMQIERNGEVLWSGSTSTATMHRTLDDLVSYLFRALDFPHGALLMTGTGLVPPDDVTLQSGDRVMIAIEQIGSLSNDVFQLEPR